MERKLMLGKDVVDSGVRPRLTRNVSGSQVKPPRFASSKRSINQVKKSSHAYQVTNLLLENRAYGVPSIALSGSTLSALDDVSVEDPDFLCIQSLAEADIVSSKMSVDNSSWQKGVRFCPDRFISRQDLISWKAKLDYEVMPGLREEISRKSLDFMDVREINSDAIVVLFKDLLVGDKSIYRTVFGLSLCFCVPENDLHDSKKRAASHEVECSSDNSTPQASESGSKKKNVSDAKQPTDQTLAPIFDLNQRLVAEEEYQDSCEMARQDKLSELKLSLCRNVGHGSNRAVKRKISWQDPVALRVGLAIINIF
ncbi:hypothetical protein DCAR_0624560 [Daucus carota subsp. sativus]|uniref:Uncharacterized protein n=1 Tax=Daucus carota subsp. sativus TaxID=79200 RepID=A0AAF0XF14_DAUCS|nr:hypothetical protein DCAR_0624560 [Daucus carota subsp. sativus]